MEVVEVSSLPKRGRLLAAVGTLALLVSACGSSTGGASQAGSSDGLVNVTIAYGAPLADHMVPSVAQAAGLFKKYGINAKIEFLESTQLLTSLRSGQVQFVSIPAPGPEILALNGTDI